MAKKKETKEKGLKATVTSKKILKKAKQFTVDLRQKEPVKSIFGQPSQFFQSQLAEDIDEMNLFLK